MKKSRNNTHTSHNERETSPKSPDSIATEVEKAVDQSTAPSPTSSSINLKNAIQLTTCSNPKATTHAILNLKNNPFFHDKRKWDESFTVAEKKELTGNIVKAAKDNDGETYITLQEEEYTVPASSHEEEDDSQESDDIDAIAKKPGRKPMPDEDTPSDSDQDPKVKRKAQNRAAQRAFRERKERYVKELEVKIKQVQDAHLVATAQLVHENQQLRAIIYRLESENYALKGIPIQPYQPPPPSIPQQPSLHQRSGSNYANIAPLLPQATSPQPSLLLPAYLSNLPSPISSPPVSSVLQSTSQSVNQMMMLASSPLQQYPMSPVIPVAMQNTSPTSKPISKKVAAKQTKSTPPPNNQPLEYTFSISTPASLRPNGGSTSSSKHNRSEPIELVQLYPPGGNRGHQQSAGSPASAADVSPSASNATLQKSDLIMLSPSTNNLAKKALSVASVSSNGSSTLAPFVADIPTTTTAAAATQDDNCSLTSDKTVSTVNTQTQQYKNMQQLEIDMFDCHIDTEGQLFCEKLLNEFCNDTFDRLLSEPLFDQMGKLNLSIGNYSVPIVTGPMTSNMNTLKEKEASIQGTTQDEPNNDKAQNDNDKHEQNEIESSESTKPSSEKKLLTCPEIWFILNQHSNFHKFTTDQLCQAVKELAKCADSGPVLEEPDLYQILAKMDQGQL